MRPFFVRPAALAALVLALVAPPADAQTKYRALSQPQGFDAAKKAAAMSMVSSGNMTSQDTLKDYYLSLFADMTNPARADNMHRARANIKKQLQTAGNASSKQTHTESNNLMLKALPSLIQNKNFHPAFRYNCILLLGELDSVEKQGFNGTATPLPAALDKLIELLADPKLGDGMHLGALIGISRHAVSGDEATRAKIAKAIVPYLDGVDKADASARNSDVKNWLECRAMEALGDTAAPTKEVVAALQTRLADGSRPIEARCFASLALGKLTYDANSGVDANALFPHFKNLVETAVDQGLSRRELRYVLYAAKRGLVGYSNTPNGNEPPVGSLAALLTGDAKSEFNQMANATGEMAKICEDKDVPSVRVPILINEIADKWRSGGFSSTEVSAEAKEALSEDTSATEEGDAPAEEGTPEKTEPDFDPFGG